MSKNLLLTFSIFLVTIASSGQEKLEPLKAYNHKDDASKKEFYVPSRRLAYGNADGCGAYLMLANRKDKAVANTFHVICAELGCIEESTLTVLFENDEKIERRSLNSHNCDGEAHFPLSKKDLELLATLKVTTISVKNEREFNSVAGYVKENDYFVNLLALVRENKIEEKKS